MKKLLLILLFPILIYAQKQTPHLDYDKGLVFRETFNDEFTTRQNGGIPTDVTFSDGVGSFNGSSSGIKYPIPAGQTDYTYRVKFSINTLKSYSTLFTTQPTARQNGAHISINSSGNLQIDHAIFAETITLTPPISTETDYELCYVMKKGVSLTVYLNGVQTGQSTSSVVDKNFQPDQNFWIGGTGYPYQGYIDGEYNLVEFYDYALSAEEVANLYEGKRYEKFTSANEILRVDGRRGAIENTYANGTTIPAVSNTAVTSVRAGDIYAMDFDGANSKLDCGGYDNLIGAKTFIFWAKPRTLGEGEYGTLMTNDKFLVYILSPEKLLVTSDYANTAYSADNSVPLNEWSNIVITRSSIGVANFYINGVLSGSADQNSGNPVAGITNIIVGNDNTKAMTWDGLISNVRIIDGILTTQEISQIYTSEKAEYGK